MAGTLEVGQLDVVSSDGLHTDSFTYGQLAKSASPTFTGTVTLPSTTSIGNVSSTEIGYLDGVTSNIQTQLGTQIGVGQTWQNVTASRALGTTYTNSTGKPIQVNIRATYVAGALSITSLYVNNVCIFMNNTSSSTGAGYTVTSIIPNGFTYRFEAAQSIDFWFELR